MVQPGGRSSAFSRRPRQIPSPLRWGSLRTRTWAKPCGRSAAEENSVQPRSQALWRGLANCSGRQAARPERGAGRQESPLAGHLIEAEQTDADRDDFIKLKKLTLDGRILATGVIQHDTDLPVMVMVVLEEPGAA